MIDGFDDRPTYPDVPDECQYTGCEKRPKLSVRFENPSEYLVYCREHAVEINKSMDGARYCSDII
jgi:hypothetical protein